MFQFKINTLGSSAQIDFIPPFPGNLEQLIITAIQKMEPVQESSGINPRNNEQISRYSSRHGDFTLFFHWSGCTVSAHNNNALLEIIGKELTESGNFEQKSDTA